jgi:MbtH protein
VELLMEPGQDRRTYQVVVNDEEQYSIWLADRSMPAGWREVGFSGSKEDCLTHIAELWSDIRPSSLRRRMGETAAGQGND